MRIAWGGGAERTWEGAVWLDRRGTLSEPRALGIEADEPGSMWLESGKLQIRQRSPRSYDGVDLLLSAPPEARLIVKLTAEDGAQHAAPIEIPVAGLSDEFFDKELDNQGNRLLVRRMPGDRLRVRFSRDTMIFSPGETFSFTLEPHMLGVDAGTKLRIRIQLLARRARQELWSQQHDVRAGRPVSIPVEVKLPEAEGVYDVVITAAHGFAWQEAVRRPLKWKKAIVERRVQLLVLDADPPAWLSDGGGELHEVAEIDPANARWWDRLGKLPRLWKGSLGNGNLTVVQHSLGELAQLNPNRRSGDVSWEAYWLPIDRPGLPHILEVEYPSDVPQTMGISVMEPNAAGALMPIGLDSGIDTPAPLVGGGTPRWIRHRLIFWPRTRTPMVLVSNLRERSPAVYGKIRVLAGWEHLPVADLPRRQDSQRLLAAYLDRPLFPENFSAAERFDVWSEHSLDDWGTFYDGGRRLVEYLEHVGYNALMLSVAADGSTIYPSKVLQPTPRYDTGVFFATAPDPIRKDVLEMLLQMFDRRRLQLIPMIEFASPLPQLEALRRQGGSQSEGIEWIGPDGKTWCQSRPARRARAPYYNVLDPRVQEAMLDVVRELVGRYSHHPSFAGVAIRLSADGYAQLPGPDWGMDDATIARFEQDTGVKLAASGPERFARRAALLAAEYRREWLEWRAEQLSRFHRRAHGELAAMRPKGRLYLADAGALAGADLESQLRPALPRRTTLAEAMLQIGIDVRHYENEPGLVLLRGERITPTGRLNARAVDLEIGQMPDVDQYFREVSTPGSLFFHPPRKVRIASFDQKSPFRPAYTWLVSQPAPSAEQNRRRFVHSLATLDAQVMVDGGWLLPLGQEAAVRDVVAVYRRLPAVRFRRVGNRRETAASQPVTFRYGVHQGSTYVYAVNDSPIRCTAQVRLDAPPGCRLEELTGTRPLPPLKHDAAGTYWKVKLRPYDVVAARLPDADVAFTQPRVAFSEAVEAALKQRISALGGRTALLRAPAPPLRVLENPGFEQKTDRAGAIPGWASTERLGVEVALDRTRRAGGTASAKMTSNGPIACLVSRPFEPPLSGRLSLSVWLRTDDPNKQPPLRLALQGKHFDRWDYYAAAPVGLDVNRPSGVSPVGTQWQRFIFPINDLPLEGLSQLQVRFDLMGPGEVWIDDVELSDLRFSDNEVKELLKLVTLIHVTLRNGRLGDCLRLLEGYWPQFLEENVPLQSGETVAGRGTAAEPPTAKQPKQPTPRTGLLDNFKNLLPKSLR